MEGFTGVGAHRGPSEGTGVRNDGEETDTNTRITYGGSRNQ